MVSKEDGDHFSVSFRDDSPDSMALCMCGHTKLIHDSHRCLIESCSCKQFVALAAVAATAAKPYETINHPAHYGGADNPHEHIKVAEALGWGYHVGNATKYLWRMGKKPGADQLADLRKARWYLDRLIGLIEREAKPQS